MEIELLILSKIEDPTIFTAKTTLFKMGYKARLLDLYRGIFYRFNIGLDDIEEVKKWLDISNYFYNPNKHIRNIIKDFEKPYPYDGWTRIIITEIDYKPVTTLSANQEIKDIYQSEVYFSKWNTNIETRAIKWSEEITNTKSRTKGLLANPHLHTWRILQGSKICTLE